MKRILYALLIVTSAVSCTDSAEHTEDVITFNDSVPTMAPPQDTIAAVADTPIDAEHAIYYVTIADTGSNYYALDRKMYNISKASGLKIDTMARYYNKEKGKIVLPDDDEDEIYRGEYYPRRGPDELLSIEYLYVFSNNAAEGTMALVSGIYESRSDADNALSKLKPHAPFAFVMRASVYIGCMH